ncbi:MAG: hypothetical protein NC453_12335 [Muribaculum sp.]|nr:hypothetical protein [Muribaculum sp.]
MKSLIYLLPFLLLSCSVNKGNEAADAVESAMFTYPDSIDITARHNLCEVQYYVNGDTLFTSERYHFISVAYSWNEDRTVAYHHFIPFDWENPNVKDRWYYVVIAKNAILRNPTTHFSGLVLRNYYDPTHRLDLGPYHADAYLYNVSNNLLTDRVELTPQIKKLNHILK